MAGGAGIETGISPGVTPVPVERKLFEFDQGFQLITKRECSDGGRGEENGPTAAVFLPNFTLGPGEVVKINKAVVEGKMHLDQTMRL